jgi:hypothetical protein
VERVAGESADLCPLRIGGRLAFFRPASLLIVGLALEYTIAGMTFVDSGMRTLAASFSMSPRRCANDSLRGFEPRASGFSHLG